MSVRNLDQFLLQRNLICKGSLDELKQTRIGIDGQHWIRKFLLSQINNEPLCLAMGGIPLSLRKIVEACLMQFKQREIVPFFVFNGLHIIRQEKPFSKDDLRPEKRRKAWITYENGNIDEAAYCWSISGSIGAVELSGPVIKILKEHGISCMRAPYSSWAQLSYMALSSNGHFNGIYAGSELLMFKNERIIVNMDFNKSSFEWLDKNAILKSLELTEDMFLDMCILAGFDYCGTFPGFKNPFNFDMTYDCIKEYRSGVTTIYAHSNSPNVQNPNYMELFLRARTAIKYHIIFDDNGYIIPLYSETSPSDLDEIFGPHLPDIIYYYIVQGLISPQVVNNFVSKVLIEGPPLCSGDTIEYREFMKKLLPLRTHVMSLLSRNLNSTLINQIVTSYFWFDKEKEYIMSINNDPPSNYLTITIYDHAISLCKKHHKNINGFLACLTILKNPHWKSSKSKKSIGLEEIFINTHLHLLYRLEFIDAQGHMLPYGLALSKGSYLYQNELLVALYLLRLDLLSNKPFLHVILAENTTDGKLSINLLFHKNFIMYLFFFIDLVKTMHIRLISRAVSLLEVTCSVRNSTLFSNRLC
jgi:hypothetical protein